MKFTLSAVINCSILQSGGHPTDHRFDAILAMICRENPFISLSDIQHSDINSFQLNFRTQIIQFISEKKRWHSFSHWQFVEAMFISELSGVQLRSRISALDRNYRKLNQPMVILWLVITIVLGS
jgi:hypothetical protein